MRTSISFLTVCLLACALSGTAWAQQNAHIFIGLGPLSTRGHTLPGSGAPVRGSQGYTFGLNFAFQVKRVAGAGIYLDYASIYGQAGKIRSVIPATGDYYSYAYLLGVKLVAPLNPRVAVYGVTSGGVGRFRSAVLNAQGSALTTDRSLHGIFAIGGGVDVRLSRRFSVRAEVRDLITGRHLAGVPGRHHVVPLFGIAVHR